MAHQAASAEALENSDAVVEEGAEKASLKSRLLGNRKLVLAGASLLAIALVGALYLGGSSFGLFGVASERPAVAKPALFYDLPEMVVNLSAAEQRAQYLKLKVALEVDEPKVLQSLEPVLPRVLDLFQVYLRELRVSDLEGSAGLFRLKEELLRRVNLELYPHQVTRVLFKEIIIQ